MSILSNYRFCIKFLFIGLLLSSQVIAAEVEQFSILTQNMNRLFNDIDDGNREHRSSSRRYRSRIAKIAKKIARHYDAPDIVALQEVENIGVMQDLARRISKISSSKYQAILIEGFDSSGIDVGYLIKAHIDIKQQRQLMARARLKSGTAPLFTRPPLLAEACFKSRCITLVNLHLRSMRGLRSHKKGKRVALKRLQQASNLAQWIEKTQTQNPDISLMLLGDFNALTPTDKYADIAGTIRGDPDNNRVRYPSKDLIRDDLLDLTEDIDKSRRYSYVYKQQKQILDYMLVNRGFKPRLQSITFSPIDRNISDHAGLFARFVW